MQIGKMIVDEVTVNQEFIYCKINDSQPASCLGICIYPISSSDRADDPPRKERKRPSKQPAYALIDNQGEPDSA